MGIPEAIIHAIEQLPVGESFNSTRFKSGSLHFSIVVVGKGRTLYINLSSRKVTVPLAVEARLISTGSLPSCFNNFHILCFVLFFCLFIFFFRNAASLLHEHTANWRVCSPARNERASVMSLFCCFH